MKAAFFHTGFNLDKVRQAGDKPRLSRSSLIVGMVCSLALFLSNAGPVWAGSPAAMSFLGVFHGFNDFTRSPSQAVDPQLQAENAAQEVTFTDIGADLMGVFFSSVVWGDYDNDGNLDILLTGYVGGSLIAKIYHNNGNGVFTGIGAALTGVDYGSVAWGDYDNDSDLDILLTGDAISARIAKIYRNDNGVFTDIGASLTGVGNSSTAWGDYDNDGDLDILLTGRDNGGTCIAKIYRNDGNGIFSDIGAALAGVYLGSVAWGDYDNDGDLDILLAGLDINVTRISKVYRNDGNGVFTDTGAALTGVKNSSVAWGDYDNDGDLDIFLAGRNNSGTYIAKIYSSNGTGLFTDSGAALTGVSDGSMAWGDYDNDGDLDILLTGDGIAKVYRNDGNGVFGDTSAALTGVKFSSAAWGDYDNDGDLDILLTGYTDSVSIAKIYRNNNSTTNTVSAAPTGLNATVTGTNVSLGWNPASDGQTPASGLTYNLRVGTTPGGKQIVSPMANPANGYRYLPVMGNGQLGTNFSLKNLAPGTYYWSVQALDTAFAGSAFAPEGSFTIAPPPGVFAKTAPANSATNISVNPTLTWASSSNVTGYEYCIDTSDNATCDGTWTSTGTNTSVALTGLTPNTLYSWQVRAVGPGGTTDADSNTWWRFTTGLFDDMGAALAGVSTGSVAWGDYDNDGDLDILLTGYIGYTYIAKVYRNGGNGVFTDIGAALSGVSFGSVAWGDYDNDGDLDILLTGITTSIRIAKIYRNDNGVFTDINATLTGVVNSSVAWGDYDNDGDLDILLTGSTGSNNITKIYRNDGKGVFSDTGAALAGVYLGSVAWGDYDNDGDLDILLTGLDLSNARISKVYRNDGNGVFSDTGAALTGVKNSSVAWGDYDNDGDLDILLAGRNDSGAYIAKIYRNNGTGLFTDSGAALTGVADGSVAWGDYDNDGDLDILLTGSGIAKVYRNDGNGAFSDTNAALIEVELSSAVWGDYDKDGDLDILLTGYTGSSYIAKVYRNNSLTANSAPTAPTGLNTTVTGPNVSLGWNPASDGQTPASGLTYNLRVGTTPGGKQIVSPMANPANGYRHLPAMGNGQPGANFSLKNLAPGTYYWSVQALDTAFVGSSFAPEDSFTVAPPPGVFAKTAPANNAVYISITPTLSWASSSNATGYEYCIDTSDNAACDGAWISTGMNTSVALTGLTPNTLYSWQVRANGLGGATYANSNTWWHFTTAPLPGVFSKTAPANNATNITATPTLSWASSSNATSYEYCIDASDNATCDGAWVSTGTATSVALTHLTPNTLYSWQVRAISPGGATYADSNAWGRFTTDLFDDIGAVLMGVYDSSAAWGDYDNDGDLDILLTGYIGSSSIAKVYRNDGNGIFTDIGAALTGVSDGSVAWGDYDNDGDLDILLTGYPSSSPIAKVYRNDGNGVFTDIGAALTGVGNSSVAWGDYDSDGDLDILLTGNIGTVSGNIAKVYRNDNGVFTDIGASLTGVRNSSVAWGDYDNDGDLDILLTGASNTAIAKVYRNDGNGVFADTSAALTGVTSGSVAWGDYDNDSNLDILLTGCVNLGCSSSIAKIYHNDGNGAFADIGAALTGVDVSSVAWGDYDNDGDLDILLTGYTGPIAKVYRNDGNGVFTDMGAALTGVYLGSVAWGDYDSDGDLDILLTGYTADSIRIANVYRNNTLTANSAPAAPTGLNATVTGPNVSLAWNPASDGQTPASGLTYNLRVGTTPGGKQIVAPMANPANGYRYLSAMGNGQTGTSFVLKNLAPGTYYWSVQTVDTAFAGSSFASEGSFTIAPPPVGFVKTAPANSATNITVNPILSWGASGGATDYEYCIDTSDNAACNSTWTSTGTATSVALTGLAPNTLYSWQVRANGLGGTTYADSNTWWHFTSAPLPSAFNKTAPANNAPNVSVTPALSWASSSNATGYEYCIDTSDNANCDSTWMDTGTNTSVALTGLAPNTLYSWQVRANGLGGTTYADSNAWWRFTTGLFDDIGAALVGVSGSSAAWGDYDKDGDLDILLTGSISSSIIAKVYRNDGNGIFTDSGVALTGVVEGSVAWGDYDNDGDLDILLTGSTGSSKIAKVYRNDGNGIFTDSGVALTGVAEGSVAWGDYDNDGDLDILLTGYSSSSFIAKVYRNDGNGVFTDIGATLAGVYFSSVAWGDYDNDGDLDILLTGSTGSSKIAKVYRNDGNGVFIDIGAALTGVFFGSVVWGDYDNDGNLDILLTGYTADSSCIAKVYHNDGNAVFTDIGAILTGVNGGSVAWGDFDNDGDLDILLTGYTGSSSIAKVYRNDGNGAFTDIGAALTGVNSTNSVVWGDYDNDGDLDILLTGYTGSSSIAKIYRNNTLTANNVPTAPTGLNAAVTGPNVFLGWNPASDGQTPASGLTYNLRVGTTPGGKQIVAPMANLANGYRHLPAMGNGQTGTNFSLKNLAPGTYYWSVQALDTAFAGSPFAPEGSFTIAQPPGAFAKTEPANSATNVTVTPALSWASSSNATGYEYCIDTSDNATCNGAWTSTGMNTSVALTDLMPNALYSWQVRANGLGGATYADSNTWWHFTTAPRPGAFAKTAPANSALDIPANPTLSWGASTGATAYEYCYDTTNDTACSTWTSNGASTSIALSGLSLGTTYYWHVRAVNVSGVTYADGGATAFWRFTTANMLGSFAKAGPSNSATGVALNPILSWGTSGGAASYEYCVDKVINGTCDTNWLSVGSDTHIELSGLSNATNYHWQIRARNTGGTTEANDGAWWSFTTQPDSTPPDGQITAPTENALIGPGAITISANAWDAPGGSGVSWVEFFVQRDGIWQPLCTVSSGYDCTWNPADLTSQKVLFAIHVHDAAGNEKVEAGGYRTAYYLNTTANDSYEPDGLCGQARPIDTNGAPQSHVFYQPGDYDWVSFTPSAGMTYVIQTSGTQAKADTIFDVYKDCQGAPVEHSNDTLGSDSRLVFTALDAQPVHVLVSNADPNQFGDQTGYNLSVRAVQSAPLVVIVAGRDRNDSLWANIQNSADSVYNLFLHKGIPKSRILYLSHNNHDVDHNGLKDDIQPLNGPESIRAAIEDWPRTQGMAAGVPFYIYLVDHGIEDGFKVSGDFPENQMRAADLDLWLTYLENTTGADQINVIYEACNSGSFISVTNGGSGSISGPNRVIITSTDDATAANTLFLGIAFSDAFWTAVSQNQDLATAFQYAKNAVRILYPGQYPWLDDNGDAVANHLDGNLARNRGLGSLSGSAPAILQATLEADGNGQAVLRAYIRDDVLVKNAWAVIVPPGYVPPDPNPDGTISDPGLPIVTLQPVGGDWYFATYPVNAKAGTYQFVIYAIDNEDYQTMPSSLTIYTASQSIFVPMSFRH